MLHKTLANSVKDIDTRAGVVCGYASSFNVVDDGNDMVLPGAFTKTLTEQGPTSKQPRIKFLYQHDSTAILGVPQLLREDGFGLYFEAKVADTTLGRDVLALYEAGVITEHSIGYETVDAEWDRSHAVRLLKTLRLFEFSAVTWGMNSDTPTVAVKSLTDPSQLSALATKAATLDTLLHSGSLRSEALCKTLERELTSLHAALAPTTEAARQPYSIEGVMASMNGLAERLQTKAEQKAASDDDKAAQAARAKKYGIGIKDGGNVTKPGQWKNLDDADFGDPVNYKLPMPDKAHADNAASRFGQEATRSQYTKAEQDIIDKRIAAAQKKFGEDESESSDNKDKSTDKGAEMNTRMVKGSGGDIAVSENGRHAAYTGTHTHGHKAFDSQGGDATHEHKHSHDGDARHDHVHDEKHSQQPHEHQRRKARDFDTLFASLSASDQLQDDWGDTFIAFTHAMSELMWEASAVRGGWAAPDDAADFDLMASAQANLSAFSKAVLDLVQRSDAADFAPSLDYDGDQFVDPDGCNADEDDDYDTRKSRRQQRQPQQMPDAPALLGKAGRAISSANRSVITDALDGMTKAMGDLQMHHKSIADLMTKTDPDRVRQDEDDVEGDDDTENGGTNPQGKNRQSYSMTPRRSATLQAATTHSQGDDHLSAIVADLDALKHRLTSVAGKRE